MDINRMSIADYKAMNKKKRSRYNNKRVIVDDISWPSKVHARYYQHLKLRKQLRDIHYFLYEVPIRLPGKITYYADFVIFGNKGEVEYVDVKGVLTQVFIMKKKLVEETYPIEIKCVYDGDF